MRQSDTDHGRTRLRSSGMGGALGLLLILGLLLAPVASATYEQVGSFSVHTDDRQFHSATGMAVNAIGAGGVPAGTVYAVNHNTSSFSETKGFHAFSYSAKGELQGGVFEKEQTYSGVAVNPATGNVYVLVDKDSPGADLVREYSADGSQLIASFGEKGAFKETVEEGPDKIHNPSLTNGIAVDSSGVVYVSDSESAGNFASRVMVFEPQSPGDYEHYVYAGRSDDIAASQVGDPVSYSPSALALDSAGNLYTASNEKIFEFALAEPSDVVCEYDVPGVGARAMTVNPESGEVFYFNAGDKKIHQLAPCNAQGEFVETTAFGTTPKTESIQSLAFNSALAWEASRPAGVLYAADAGDTFTQDQGMIFAPAEVNPPLVESESVSSVTSSTATLGAQINPQGSPTRYAFQYITEAAWQANEPNEVQSLTVSAEGGSYALTATTATGSGKISAGSIYITGVSIDFGAFNIGDAIAGLGIPANTTIESLNPKGPGSLALSHKATETAAVALSATETTTPIPYNAPATGPGSVQNALNALAGIATNRVSSTGVTASGGPGDGTGSAPYTITFSGTKLAGADVPQLTADSSSLSGTAHTATVATVREGGNGFAAGASEAPLGGADLGGGQSPLSAGVSLVGLQPDTDYHYRVIATSYCDPEEEAKVCEGAGPDQAFHTFPAQAPGLPDGRAYELVSPVQKSGGEVFPANPEVASCGRNCKPGANGAPPSLPMQSSPDGEAVVYEGFPFSHTEGSATFNEYISRRTASGWQTTILSPPLTGSVGGYKGFDAELSRGLLIQRKPTLSPEAPSDYANLYTQPTSSPAALTPLLKDEPPNRSIAEGLELTFAGASADFSRLFFEANDALTGETPFAPEAVDGGAGKNNLYESAGGQLRLVNVAPGNAETAPGALFGSAAHPVDDEKEALSHVISDDGSRVFWSDEAGQVYVRENGEATTAIPDPGEFLSAAADGSRVLLRNGHLYDLETETITDLTEGKGGFQGIIGQSDDLSSIYFVDTAALAPGAEVGACKFGSGTSKQEEEKEGKVPPGRGCNLYAWQEGTSALIGTLIAIDNRDVRAGSLGIGDWSASPAQRTAEASPNGRWVAFLSQVSLTGYDNTGPCSSVEHTGSEPCPEVFLYDSASGKLTCPSCNPSGRRPLGESRLSILREAPSALPQPRYLTDEGRLFFDSADSLSTFDTNNGVEDVYEYEPNGVGGCKREAGCVSLISAGHEPVDSNFLAADETGKNVFFTTRDQLVLKDRDDLIDLYVAREGGGIGAETETARSECQGEACQAAIVPPNDPTPGSSSFEGAGNVDERKATKKHKRKHKHAKKHKSHKRSHGRAANHNRGGAK